MPAESRSVNLIDLESIDLINSPSVKIYQESRLLNSYPEWSQIEEWLREMGIKKFVTLHQIGKTHEGRNILLLQIGENNGDKPEIFIDGALHAREWISVVTVLNIADRLIRAYEAKDDDYYELSHNIVWYVIPVVNVDGYVYSHTTERLWRKNRRLPPHRSNCYGVDLNRNWNISWSGYGSENYACSNIYHGPEPNSEPEVKAIISYLEKRKAHLKAYLSFHSYGQLIIYPYSYDIKKEPRNIEQLKKVSKNLSKETDGRYANGKASETLCTSTDWAAHHLKIPYTFTIELRDTGFYGFLLPSRYITPTVQESLKIIKVLSRTIIDENNIISE
ncbi:DgyrCDS2337 [Dimorphilus gyrociliatus]|uniref:DgyrCDS2337 n=1 Tax=Dimorphilus gyrociliatus TaxID=2664684 RepID=A0A7I8VBA2_9ANNE|nr:DgyrCDS2337 [Dimorphilus gyrociliatus]